jgi:hypothetical protein
VQRLAQVRPVVVAVLRVIRAVMVVARVLRMPVLVLVGKAAPIVSAPARIGGLGAGKGAEAQGDAEGDAGNLK